MPGPNDSESKPSSNDPTSSELLAADEPTAMWDEASLRQAGFEQIAAAPPPVDAAANPAVAAEPAGPSIVIDNMPDAEAAIRQPISTPVRQHVPAPRRKQAAGLSWPLTIGLAAALGTFVYLIVRFLR